MDALCSGESCGAARDNGEKWGLVNKKILKWVTLGYKAGSPVCLVIKSAVTLEPWSSQLQTAAAVLADLGTASWHCLYCMGLQSLI